MKPESADEKNVMPSMVVRQQRMLMGQISANPGASQLGSSGAAKPKHAKHRAEPAPGSSSIPLGDVLACDNPPSAGSHHQPLFDQDGLVVPRKVLQHPSSLGQPMIKDLNRELKFNQVRGKNVLEQKSELRKVMEKLEDSKRRREAEQERLNRRTSLELRLDERAQRLASESAKAPEPAGHSAAANFAGIKSTLTR